MGGSSPPFLYGTPSSYSFHGPTDRPFNPKSVTQASWTRPQSKPKPKGPYVNFNRHPDSYNNIPDGKTRWTPMSSNTKPRVILSRKIQLGLRILTLLGALGSLFCSIVIKNAAVTVIWIIRVGPAVAILHTLYGIYHLCRSAITRPPGSQASYMLFASTFDLGLVPFYVFSAFLAYKQWTEDAYHWTTMLGSDYAITLKISETTFILSVVNGGLHLISLAISIFLCIIFRQITRLPPDLNPLEDNLTARPHKRSKSELAEKHASNSTLDSAMSEVPLIGPPRQMPFMHTRGMSSETGSSRMMDVMTEKKRHSHISHSSHRMSYPEPPTREPPIPEPPMPQMPFHQHTDTDDYMYRIPEHNMDVFARPTSSISRGSPVREPSPELPNRSQCVSPASDNWVTYPSRPSSPAEADNAAPAPREPSSNYSRGPTPASTNSGVMDWVAPSHRNGWDIGETIREDILGEYESLPVHEYYGNDDENHDLTHTNGYYDNAERDIGDHQIHIFPDPDETDDSLRVNPLALNPPTPQPLPSPTPDDKPSHGRTALTDIPNLDPTPPVTVPPIDSPQKNNRFYGELEGLATLNLPRKISGSSEKKSKLKRKSQKNAYGALKQNDDYDTAHANDLEPPTPDPAAADGDRKGRVISNSGVDISHHLGPGSNISYGNYIAGLGVGRRRDVSGKMAEEGRSGMNNQGSESQSPGRAAGWARFAGL